MFLLFIGAVKIFCEAFKSVMQAADCCHTLSTPINILPRSTPQSGLGGGGNKKEA
jgi:hypothetical protein